MWHPTLLFRPDNLVFIAKPEKYIKTLKFIKETTAFSNPLYMCSVNIDVRFSLVYREVQQVMLRDTNKNILGVLKPQIHTKSSKDLSYTYLYLYLNAGFSLRFVYCVFVFVLDQLLQGIMEYLYLIGVFHIFDHILQIQT